MKEDQTKILASIFQKLYPVSKTSLDIVLESCEILSLEKGEQFSSIGILDRYEYFILKGVVHRFVFAESGEVIPTAFFMDMAVITPHFARTIEGKSIFFLETLTDVILARLPVKIFDSLRYSYEDLRAFGMKVVEQELLRTISSDIAQRSMTAADRLVAFRNKFPNLENLIPHSLIAAYLGVTPVSFSRLRKELSRP